MIIIPIMVFEIEMYLEFWTLPACCVCTADALLFWQCNEDDQLDRFINLKFHYLPEAEQMLEKIFS